jgi:DNA-damage-inducible protein J
MKNEMLSTRIDQETKLAFTYVCEEIGLSPSQAIKLLPRLSLTMAGYLLN